jgi:hypothetical protein
MVSTSPANSDLTANGASSSGDAAKVSVFVRGLFACTVFLGAFLLFLIEPLFAKLILPWFGGSAAVWATCLVFFQSALLLGYFYAHATSRRLAAHRQAVVHIAVLGMSLVFLPIAPQVFWRSHLSVDPAWHILGLLTCSIGLPFVLLSATGPLMQSWYARRSPGRSPYHLFAVSNFASLAALLSFPFLIEPRLASHQQTVLWSVLYSLFVVCCGVAAWISRRPVLTTVASSESAGPGENPPTIGTKMIWLSYAACGSMLLLAVTNHLAENVAPVPLLWVLPLAVYLLSFTLVFARRSLYPRWLIARLLAVALGTAGYAIYDPNATHPLQITVPLFCGSLLVFCMFCHGELAIRKPVARFLTTFYLTIALGGAIGAICVGLIAPHVLSGVYELPIALMLTAFLWHEGWQARIFWAAIGLALAAVLVQNVRSTQEDSLLMARNFYGALRVQQSPPGSKKPYRTLTNGKIKHGDQFLNAPESSQPTTYYGRDSGVGLALRFCCKEPKRVGVIGLGAGTLAAYAKPGDAFRFYEINPLVIPIAREWFSYLKQSLVAPEIVLGDARLSLEREPPQQFDVLAVDAFTGDAIPVHLLTKEAFALYFRHLKPEGILAVHTSNIYLDLTPVVKLLANDADYHAELIASEGDAAALISNADWVLVTRNLEFLNDPQASVGSEPIVVPPQLRLWTDDYNNLFQVLHPLKKKSDE